MTTWTQLLGPDKFDKPWIGNKILQREVLLIIFTNTISDLISCHFDANLSTVIDTIKSIRVTWARRGGSIFDKVHFEYVERAHNKLLSPSKKIFWLQLRHKKNMIIKFILNGWSIVWINIDTYTIRIITLLTFEVSAEQTCPILVSVTAVKLGVEITRPIVARTAERGKKRLFNKCRRKKRATNQGQSGAKLNAHMSSLAEMRICHRSYAFLI